MLGRGRIPELGVQGETGPDFEAGTRSGGVGHGLKGALAGSAAPPAAA